jgi:carbonic anhydrase
LAATLKNYKTDKEALDTLVEQNVRVQVRNIERSSTIVNARAAGRNVYIHGWVFDISEGKLRDLSITDS